MKAASKACYEVVVTKWQICRVATSLGCTVMCDCLFFRIFIALLSGIFGSEQSHILNSSPLHRIATPTPYEIL